MNKILEVIYNDYDRNLTPENPLYKAEIQKKTDTFFETWFSHMSYEEQDKACTMLAKLHSDIQENAFEVGFYAGVQLLFGGVQS